MLYINNREIIYTHTNRCQGRFPREAMGFPREAMGFPKEDMVVYIA